MPYTVYKHTSPSGKVYIGITKLKPSKRWQNGKGYKNNPHFHAAIKRYGWENFEHEIIAEGLSQEAAERLEVELIVKHRATDRGQGYNLDRGGSAGPKHSPETRQKISEANSRRVWTEEARRNVGAASRGRTPNAETRKKMAEAHRGRLHTQASKDRIRTSRAKYKGQNAPNYGKHLSADTRAKISELKKKQVVCVETATVYPSIKEAAEALGAHPSKVGAVCNGKRQTTKGLHFYFLDREEVVI